MGRTRILVEYTADDEAVINQTRSVVLEHAEAVSSAVYAKLLDHPETRAYFSGSDGRLDPGHVSMREGTLAEWLRLALDTPPGDDLAAALAGIGRAHTRRGGHEGVHVRGRYLVAMMSVIQSELSVVLADAMPPEDALRAVGAWRRLLTIHLDLLLSVYGAAEGNPRWY